MLNTAWRLFGIAILLATGSTFAQDAAEPPSDLEAVDQPWDGGTNVELTFVPSPQDTPERGDYRYIVSISGEYGGLYTDQPPFDPDPEDYEDGRLSFTAEGLVPGEPYYFRARGINSGDIESAFVETTEAIRPQQEWFDGSRFWLAAIMFLVCAAIVGFIAAARSGVSLRIRKIAGLEAVDEAVGRATEMGRSCLFVPGIQDMNDIQTIAGLSILSRVAEVAAEYAAQVEVPTSKSLVMTSARETVQSAFVAGGRPDAYNEDKIYYVTDEQFGYVAYLAGMMVRERPAACFYMGSFYAESLILAETGNSIGAIQVAGTAQPSQLPFFVASCDFTLIGEEFFAASAYLSGDPDQLGSLKGQDFGKVIVAGLMIVGCVLMTIAVLTDAPAATAAAEYLRDVVLR